MYTLRFYCLPFSRKKTILRLLFIKEQRLVCPHDMVVLFDRPVERIFAPLGAYGAGFELTKFLFLVRAKNKLSSSLKKSLDAHTVC